ncbi:hypothetical protein [Paenisporosarcina antarctica]|uniref:hypothetical protein n=1 Tax=Paenisporosarcina antarctica TaxID=417367 RepID=UPI0014170D4F|nr:hypothetical protein [Paenisporosarcina antarctica]
MMDSKKTSKRKRYSFDLDAELMKEVKIQSVMQEKNVYELVEKAIKKYMLDLK